jgi:GalNAc-alpha-(1->4)-GalNAc-alpha-(1->3)-diNAcBac-PP-undecaprenol alpha-1,4-N-acetyl-D-galactosaminyltransferase
VIHKKKMKVVIVIPSLAQGGAERVISELANDWAGVGHDIHLLTLYPQEDFYQVSDAVIRWRLNMVYSGHIKKVVNEIRTLIKMRGRIISLQPDFVLSIGYQFNVLAIMATRLTGIPVFISDRSNLKVKLPLITRIGRKLLYRWAKGVIAQTESAKKLIEKGLKNKNVAVIHNPLREINVTGAASRERIILNVGRLVREKGQEHLLEVFAKLDAPGWRLVILGEGPLRKTLEQKACKLRIEGRVEFPGAVKDMDRWLAKASIFVLSSLSEGFPNALCEAMAAGLPCISFDCDTGPRDIIENGKNGLLVPVGDRQKLQTAISSLLNDSGLREKIGANAGEIRSRLTKENTTWRYIDFCMQNS